MKLSHGVEMTIPHVSFRRSSATEESSVISDKTTIRLLLPFIKYGFGRADRAFQVVNLELCDEHIQCLKSFSINVADSGQYVGI